MTHARSHSHLSDEMDERKSRDLALDPDPHPLEMWTGPTGMPIDGEETGTVRSIGREEDSHIGVKQISTTRIVALTIIMILTYFLGVSLMIRSSSASHRQAR